VIWAGVLRLTRAEHEQSFILNRKVTNPFYY